MSELWDYDDSEDYDDPDAAEPVLSGSVEDGSQLVVVQVIATPPIMAAAVAFRPAT